MIAFQMTKVDARALLDIGPYATAHDVKCAFKRKIMGNYPNQLINGEDLMKRFQMISAAYKRLIMDTNGDEVEIDEEYPYKLFRKMFEKERQVVRVYTEHGSLIILGRRYNSRRNSDSNEEDFDASHYSFQSAETVDEPKEAQTKAEKKRQKKKKQRENKRQAKENLQKEREEIKNERQKAVLMKPNKQQDEQENNEKHAQKVQKPKPARKLNLSREENRPQESKKLLSALKHKYPSNLQATERNKTVSPISQGSNSDVETSPEKVATNDAEIDIDCAFFANSKKAVQKMMSTRTNISRPSNNPPTKITESKIPAKDKDEGKQQEANIAPEIVHQLATEGNEKAENGKYKEAALLFSQAISLDTANYRLFTNRSYCYEKLNDFEKALYDAERATSIAPKWSKGYFRKARALVGMQRYTEAEKAFEEVLKLDKENDDTKAELYHVRVKRLQDMGFSKQQSVIAIRKYNTVDAAVEGVLGGGIPAAVVEDVYVSDEEEVPEDNAEAEPPTNDLQTLEDPNKAALQHSGFCSVWIGNVSKEVTESHLYTYFVQFGPIRNIRIHYDKFYAFVNYFKSESTTLALKAKRQILMQGTTLVLNHPLQKFVPNRLKDTRHSPDFDSFKGASRHSPNSAGTTYHDIRKECYFWRRSGCHHGPDCRFLHIPENQGIDGF